MTTQNHAELVNEFEGFIAEQTVDASQPIRMRTMLAAGFLTVTIRNEVRGHHRTLRFTPRLPRGEASRDAWDRLGWWVKDAEGAYIGILAVKGSTFELRYSGRSTSDRAARYAAELVVEALIDGEAQIERRGERYTLVAADRCGRCSRELTDPESIARGIGPECHGKATGSKRAAAR